MASDLCAGRVCIVTGAGRGLGREYALMLAANGAKVVVNDLGAARDGAGADAGPAQEVVDEIVAAGGEAAANTDDISNWDGAAGLVQQAIDTFGRLDVLVNNAGRIVFHSLLDTTDEDWDGLMRTNARGSFVHCRAALPLLEQSPAGAIVNIASISGLVGLRDQVAYCMTKGAIVQLTRALAVECAGAGVRVNAVAPGAVATPLLLEPLSASGDLDAALREVGGHHPIGRISTPDEIARLVVFLASPAASFITGSIVAIDGGYTAA
jgi:NAD(P)-dependent dehydrogenase (short-subunit alcohol dehydrogenase family)